MSETASNSTPRPPASLERVGLLPPILCSLLVAYGVAAFLTILLSLTGARITTLTAWLIVAVSVVPSFLYFRRFRSPDGGRTGYGLTAGERRLLGAGLLFYLLLWLVAYTLPDSKNDGLWYHNPTLHFWALNGRIHWITVDYEPFWTDLVNYSWNGYLKGVEGIGFLFLRAVPVSRFLNGLNLVILPLGCLGIANLARFLGAGRFPAILAGVLFLFVPNVICHAFDLYIDAAVASFYIALFAVSAFAFRSLENGVAPKKFVPALGCALGLALSSKGTAAVLLLLVPVLLGIYWRRAVRRFKISARQGVVSIGLVLFGALLISGYWYLRNYIHTGSPLYPIGLRIAGRTVFPGVEVSSQFPPPDTPLTRDWSQVLRVLYSWIDNPAEWHLALTEVSHNSGGLGLLWLFGGVPALTWLLVIIIRRRPEILRPGTGAAWIGVLSLAAVLFFAMPPRHNHKARYVIWLYGIGLPAFALAAGRIWRAGLRSRRRWGRIWVTASIAVFLAQGLYTFGYHVKRISLARQGVKRGSFQPAHLLRAAREPYPPGYYLPQLRESVFQRILAFPEPVALGGMESFFEQRNIVGHLTQGDSFGVRPIYFLSRERAADPGRLSRFIRDRGIRFVVWNPQVPVPETLGRIAEYWELIPTRWYYVLAVDPDRGGEAL